MKKTILLASALFVGIASFSQSMAKKTINPKYLQKTSISAKNKMLVEPQPTAAKGININAVKLVSSSMAVACSTKTISTSWNCFGVGGGLNTSEQNCLSYNSDLNSLVWTQRGSKQWPIVTSSGFMQATIINATTLVKDSVILYKDATTHHARFPSGVLLNPTTNTSNSYTNAIAVAYGVVTDNTNWTGTAYTAKPLWSTTALSHTVLPTGDSMYAAAPGGQFGHDVQGLGYEGVPSTDVQALPDGKTVVSIGSLGDHLVTCTNCNPLYKGLFVKAVLNNAGNAVNWTVDSTSLVPSVYKGSLGYILGAPRMAFGPDGLHGYAVFVGRLSTTYGNKSDSAMTPILYATTDGGNTWTQKLAGYDWMANHPEVEKNVGELTSNKRFYTFDEFLHGADVTVDANNVLHFVTCVDQSTSQPGPGGTPTTIDSLGIFSPIYQYDYINYHPIIWDFMTDGNCWSTMMVDSILSAACGSQTVDSTSIHTAMGGSMPLSVTSHITVSRSKDGTKVFYGWADSDPGITGVPYNISPDILMKAYDVTSGKVTATINATNRGTCFYPFLSDISYNDGTNWVVPAVYTIGHFVTTNSPQTTYDASSQADYCFTNCGTFSPSADFSINAPINHGFPYCSVSIKQNNEFESSISNYPNPFNNATTIAVTLTENKNVDVKVYNAIGTLVFNKKVNGNVGENTVNFDANNLSSGVYYYTVTAGNQQATKKMIIQK